MLFATIPVLISEILTLKCKTLRIAILTVLSLLIGWGIERLSRIKIDGESISKNENGELIVNKVDGGEF